MIFFSQSNRVLLRKERKAEERAKTPMWEGLEKSNHSPGYKSLFIAFGSFEMADMVNMCLLSLT
jgi:hypothetical protein